MKQHASRIYQGLAITICAVSFFSLLPIQAIAQTNKAQKKVQVQLGKPSVWSIGQAHYLLANMRLINRGLKTHMPTETELNPSAANATRIQILKTLLNVEGQFNQIDAVGNQAAIRENQISLKNREAAQAALPEKQRQLEPLNAELLAINTTIAEKQAKVDRLKGGRDALAHPTATPPVFAPPPTKEEDDLAIEVAKLTVVKSDIERRRNDLTAEVNSLKATANGTVGGPTLAEPDFSTAPRPVVGDLAPLITKALDKAVNTTPSIAASIALDNYIAMQYEIIAKQMTLLRDEVGPEERLIFLELPTSFYTVPCKADNHMIQLQWQAEEYLEDDEVLAEEGGQGMPTDFADIERQKLKEIEIIKRSTSPRSSQGDQNFAALISPRLQQENVEYTDRWKSVRDTETDSTMQKTQRLNAYVQASPQQADPTTEQGRRFAVRALDIIPRQNALNVNATYNTVSQMNFLGVLKFISGLGIKVDYQRQQELYEQYLQQEVFASGYGKGADTFGWTFAPLPGTKRVAPGVRTTYAILAVPRKASALQLKVQAITYSRGGTPNYNSDSPQLVAESRMIVRIPNEFTENFHVKEANYTSVRKGERVGVLLKGDYFSPQIGVLINSVPLTRAVAITNNESTDATTQAAVVGGVQGSYELISSNELYMTFSMADKNIGTPTITLVTPEKTTAINFFKLKINYHQDGLTSLQELSKTEPMFVDDFDVNSKLQITPAGSHRVDPTHNPNKLPVPFIKAKLEGKGLRRSADIYIDDSRKPLPHLQDQVIKLNRELIKQKIEAEKIANSSLTDETAREKVKNDLVDAHVKRIDDRLKARNRKLTKKEKERIATLKREQLDDDYELYKALRKKEVDGGKSVTEFEELPPDAEYVDQDSTGAYILYFRQPQKAKWTIRYRNDTKQGYEEKVFDVERAFPLAYKLIGYKPDANGNAEITLEFSTDNDRDNPITSISIDEGTAKGALDPRQAPLKPEGIRNYRQTFNVSAQDPDRNGKGLLMDQITATVKRTGMDAQTVKITLPLIPKITNIENPNQTNKDKARGFVDEEPAVLIKGENLHHVEHVFFGTKEATKVGKPGRTEMVVIVPKGDHLTDIKFKQVPVRVETDTASGESLPSNIIFYTYEENLAPKKPEKPEQTSRSIRDILKLLYPSSTKETTNPK